MATLGCFCDSGLANLACMLFRTCVKYYQSPRGEHPGEEDKTPSHIVFLASSGALLKGLVLKKNKSDANHAKWGCGTQRNLLD